MCSCRSSSSTQVYPVDTRRDPADPESSTGVHSRCTRFGQRVSSRLGQAEIMVISDDFRPDQPPEPASDGGGDRSPASSRRRLLTLGAGGVAAALVGVGAAGPAAGGPLRRASVAVTGASPSPSGTPSATPVMTIVTRPGDVGPGDLFISDMAEKDPRLVIAGSTGDELWSRSGAKSYANFRLQSYQGRPVFT